MESLFPTSGLIAWIGALGFWMSFALLPMLPWELWRRWRAGQLNAASAREMLASASPLLPNLLTGGLVLAFIAALFNAAANLQLTAIPTTPLSALLCLLLVDFLYYIDHRCGHRVRAYWAISHSVHHSSPQYDQTTGLRVSFIDGFLSPWFYLPAILIGFDPWLVAACLGFILGYQQWLHTEAIGRLPWLDGWLNTPSNHRVHHGSQAQYLDKNYGAVLMIWDRMFGSYQPEVEAVRYGLTEAIGSSHPVRVHLHEALRLLRDLNQTGDWRTRWLLLWKPPGWSR